MTRLMYSGDVVYRFTWIEGSALAVVVIVDNRLVALTTRSFKGA